MKIEAVFLCVLAVVLIVLICVFLSFAVKERGDFARTNYDMCLGKEGVVIESISNLNATGQVKVCGQVWSARSENNTDISKDTVIKVIGISGAKLIVAVSDN